MSSTWVNQYFVKFKERCRGGIHQSYRKKLSYGASSPLVFDDVFIYSIDRMNRRLSPYYGSFSRLYLKLGGVLCVISNVRLNSLHGPNKNLGENLYMYFIYYLDDFTFINLSDKNLFSSYKCTSLYRLIKFTF
jgi:hypothetical protein